MGLFCGEKPYRAQHYLQISILYDKNYYVLITNM